MKRFRLFVLVTIVFAFAAPVLAGDFDGSKGLICATVDARDCVRGEDCFQGLAEAVGAPEFIRIDFANKRVIGPLQATPIMDMEKDHRQILLLGKEQGYAWVLAIDQMSGYFSGTLTNYEGTFLLFGSCTPL